MRVLIRADASSRIGTGHVYRCMALAEEIVGRGHEVLFACADAPGALLGLLAERGWRAVALPDGRDEAGDAAALAAAAGAGWDWLIVDHYERGAVFERAARPLAARLLAIDDLADRAHDCDVLVDSSHGAEEAGEYDALVPPACRRLVGQDYVILRKAFRALTPTPPRAGPVRRLLVSLGGNDPVGMTIRALRTLARPQFAHLEIEATSSRANLRLDEVRAAAAALPNARLHVDTAAFEPILQSVDLCLGAGGTTTWERMYLGKPALVAMLADNQTRITGRLAGLGLIASLGHARDFDDDYLAARLAEALADSGWRLRAAQAGMRLVDGRGALRVVDAMEQGAQAGASVPLPPAAGARGLTGAAEGGVRQRT
jgi:UDP-2,4-diacetamido-2,4,6-trideoxy-beta-L-altropyranose hydrolase